MAAKKPTGLGKGLGALLGDDVLKTETTGTLTLPISQVETCSAQPRKYFDEVALSELADSIREHGIIQPMILRSCPVLATPWTAARQAPLSMRFSRQEYWSRWPCPPPVYI